MIFSHRLQQAIEFAIKVHELDQKQKRKGKDVAYITHPLAVGLILSRVTDKEDIIIAGILHDTIEDCRPYGSITKEMIAEKFGERVAELVDAVTEPDPTLSWDERKLQAFAHMKQMDQEMLLLKSADVLHNLTDLVSDLKKDGEQVFDRFNVSKEKTIWRYEKLLQEFERLSPKNPLLTELQLNVERLTSY